MNTIIVPHAFAEYIVKRSCSCSIILMHDPDDRYETVESIRKHAMNCLFLEFYDLSTPSDTHRGPRWEDMEEAIKFARWWRHERVPDMELLVSCTAGVSRSPAMAYVVRCAILGDPEVAAQTWNKRVHYPNAEMVRIAGDMLCDPRVVTTWGKFMEERASLRARKGKNPKVLN